MSVTEALEWVAVGVDAVGVIIILIGFVMAVISFLPTLLKTGSVESIERIQVTRCALGTYIVFALELMIVSDLIHTVLTHELMDLAYLGALVAIRTMIGYFLNKEIQEIHHERDAAAGNPGA